MEREEAIHLLHSMRPEHPEDLANPVFRDALALLETDAELAAWWAAQQSFDAEFSAAYERVPVPIDLKATILAGMRAHAAAAPAVEATDTIPFPEVAERASKPSISRFWVGLAASVALLFIAIGAVNVFRGPSAQDIRYAGVPDLLHYIDRELGGFGVRFDRSDSDPTVLKSYLAGRGLPIPADVPGTLAGVPTIGCLKLSFDGKNLSMICFKSDDGTVYHLITGLRSDFEELCKEGPKQYELQTTGHYIWADESRIHILTGHDPDEDLSRVI